MGGKQWKIRKHLLFYGACLLIFLSIGEGCIFPAGRVQVLPEGMTPMGRASLMADKGNYRGALDAFSKIARSHPDESPGDRALFDMGCIWVYPDNPDRNYKEALKYFERLLRDFPRSPLNKKAGAWADLLNKQILHDRQLETKQALHDRQVKELEDKIASYIKQVSSCKEDIRSCKEQINSCREQINALKEIDIGIEKKKREGLPED